MKQEDVIELGVVSADTKGSAFIVEDGEQTEGLPLGLTDD
jgi:hypothetical protein